jgi:menaquinone-dependent protoporphyrinogen oxidase
MAATILVAYATKHGSTAEVAQSIAATLRRRGFEAEAVAAGTVDDLDGYSGVVLGGSLYMGRWHADAIFFLRRFERELADHPLAIFAMGPSDVETGTAGSREQLEKALRKFRGVKPAAVAIFGGVLDPTQHRFPFNRLDAFDARDWDAIEAWAAEVAKLFGYGKPALEARDPRRELQQSPR